MFKYWLGAIMFIGVVAVVDYETTPTQEEITAGEVAFQEALERCLALETVPYNSCVEYADYHRAELLGML